MIEEIKATLDSIKESIIIVVLWLYRKELQNENF